MKPSPLDDLTVDPVSPGQHSAASQEVLNRLARRMALFTALMSPLVPIASGPSYVSLGLGAYWGHSLVVIAAIALGLFRNRLNARQITIAFAVIMSVLVLTAVANLGLRTPLLTMLGIGVAGLAMFVSRLVTLVYGAVMLVLTLALHLYHATAGFDAHLSAVTTSDWSAIGAWLAVGVFGMLIAVTVLSSLVGELETANLAERREREHRFMAERGARQTDAQLRQLLDNAPVGITLVDDKGDITGWNRVNEKFLGVTSDQMLGSSLHDFLTRADSNHPLLPKADGLFRGQSFYNLTLQAVTNRGVANLLMSGCPIFDEAGRVDGGIMIGVEISSLQTQYAALADLPVSEQIAQLAHDIRSPLMALGLSMEAFDLMLQSAVPDLERIRSKVPVIMEQQAHAAEVVEAYYRGLRERTVRDEQQNPARLAQSAVDVIKASFKAAGISITVDTELAEDAQVRTQSVLVRQVIINLLTNARDAIVERLEGQAVESRQGMIHLRVEAHPDTVLWAIEDNGGGELPADADLLFERGYTTKPVGEGTGMGLFIGRATATHLGGTLSAHQGEDGLVFELRLPRSLDSDD